MAHALHTALVNCASYALADLVWRYAEETDDVVRETKGFGTNLGRLCHGHGVGDAVLGLRR